MREIEITIFRKRKGTLSKQIWLDRDGKIKSDGSACKMTEGEAYREYVDGVEALADLLDDMRSDEALALGRLRDDLPDGVRVITKKKLDSSTPHDTIARTEDYLLLEPGEPAFLLIDHDRKGMSNKLVAKLRQAGGVWKAITAVCPGLVGAARVVRPSTSAGLYHKRTREWLGSTLNKHIYVEIEDGADVERALKTLQDRLWLAGYGFYIVGAIGQLLKRSIIDASVFGPERLVFEGAPIMEVPVMQDAGVRRCMIHRGNSADTLRAIPALSEREAKALAELMADAARPLEPKADEVRRAWARDFAIRHNISEEEAERIATNALRYMLETRWELEFDDPALGIRTVNDVLAEPDRYIGETLADPLEGRGYGRSKAKVFSQPDGRLMIHSFAHGGINYQMAGQGVGLYDFFAYMEMLNYIYIPTRQPWPAKNVDARVPPVPLLDAAGQPVLDDRGDPIIMKPSAWLARHRPVEQITWAPGLPMQIKNRLANEGGWVERNAVSSFNLYRPPECRSGNPHKIGPWLDHLRKIYPDDHKHIIRWLAQRVQHPDVKINHALVLGGSQGIGKDSLLQPVRFAVGAWNFREASPKQAMGRFNGFLKSVILRVNEARDLGEYDRYAFYDHMKAYIAEPPEVLLVDEKNLREHYIANATGVIFTTNHKTNGIHLDRDDRRHFVAWSDLTKDAFDESYFAKLHEFYEHGGNENVATYLAELDLTGFNAKAPPPQTPAFWAIVDAGGAPEDAEFADVLDALEWPPAVTLDDISGRSEGDFATWLKERKNFRVIPFRLESCGYVPVRRNDVEGGRWKVNGKRTVIYAKKELSLREQQEAARDLTKHGMARNPDNILRPAFGGSNRFRPR
jgi:hypothetical protein